MLEQRKLKFDLVALGISAAAIFLALAIFSFDPADPPTALAYPPRAHASNICGWVGALLAGLAFQGFGLGAYYLTISLGALAVALVRQQSLSDPLQRVLGWLASLVGICTGAAMALPTWTHGTVLGAGGLLGATGRGWLETHCAKTGAYIFVTCLVLGGLLLSTDYLILRLAVALVRRPSLTLRSLLARTRRSAASAPAAATAVVTDQLEVKIKSGDKKRTITLDEEEADDEAEAADKKGPRVKSGRAAAEIDAEASEEESGAAGEEPEEAAAAAETPAATTAAEAAKASQKSQDRLRVVPPRKNERQAVLEELEAASQTESNFDYELPPIDLLLESEEFCFDEQEKDVRRKAKVLEKTFADFGFKVKVVEIETGPVIAQFEVELEAGLRLSKITSLADDLAIALRVPSVRIVAPIPGKNTVGIEVPNLERQLVRLREVIEESNGKSAKMRIPVYLGKDVSGKAMVVDLTTLPHLLIAGRTGTGKSVALNTIIMSMLMTRRPDDVRMLFIDPKMVELSCYMKLPHLMHPVVTDMKKAEAILGWAVDKMEERYALLARAGVRHISVYNQLGREELYERLQPESEEEKKQIPTHLPYIVIVADEMADLMMTAAKEVEGHIIRLAQKSRAVGIHLVLATQKPTVDVITGLIKSNLPARIAFQVASRTDSRVVLDEMGADKLLGNGDMLFLWPGTSTLLRGQGAFVSDDEINRVVDFVGTSAPQFVAELVNLKPAAAEGTGNSGGRNGHDDELFDAAVDIVVREGRGSVSLLQRALGIGYGRAARLIDYMAEDGIVGQYNGSQAREVLITIEQWEAMSGQSGGGGAPAPASPPAPSRSRVIALEDPPKRIASDKGRGGATVLDAEPTTASALLTDEEARCLTADDWDETESEEDEETPFDEDEAVEEEEEVAEGDEEATDEADEEEADADEETEDEEESEEDLFAEEDEEEIEEEPVRVRTRNHRRRV